MKPELRQFDSDGKHQFSDGSSFNGRTKSFDLLNCGSNPQPPSNFESLVRYFEKAARRNLEGKRPHRLSRDDFYFYSDVIQLAGCDSLKVVMYVQIVPPEPILQLRR